METQNPTQTLAEKAAIKVDLSWTAAIVPDHERTMTWYGGGAALVLAFTVYGILTGSWAFALVMLLLGGLYVLLRHAPVPRKTIRLTEKGFFFGNDFTSWDECESFWLIRTPSWTELHIRRKRGWNREAVIQTGGIDLTEIRSAINHFLQEETDRRERLIDAIIRLCKL